MNLTTDIKFLSNSCECYYTAKTKANGDQYESMGMEKNSSALRGTLLALVAGLKRIESTAGAGHKVFVGLEDSRMAARLNQMRSCDQLTGGYDDELWKKYLEARNKFHLTFALSEGKTIS